MSLVMTAQERQEFLAGLHVGVLSVAVDGRAPLTVPVWYSYEPDGLVSFSTGRDSRKAEALRAAGKASLCVQTEEAPYRYVTVEGPVVEMTTSVDPDERRALAHRYLGPELGDMYIESTPEDVAAAGSVMVRIEPRHWLSTDYGKQFG